MSVKESKKRSRKALDNTTKEEEIEPKKKKQKIDDASMIENRLSRFDFNDKNEKEIFKLLIETENITKCFVDIIKLFIAQYSRGKIIKCKDCGKEAHCDINESRHEEFIYYIWESFYICYACIKKKDYCEYCANEGGDCECCPKHIGLNGEGECVPLEDCAYCDDSSTGPYDPNDPYW